MTRLVVTADIRFFNSLQETSYTAQILLIADLA